VVFSYFLDFIWTWILNFLNVLTIVGLGRSFKNSDLDRKMRQTAHPWVEGQECYRQWRSHSNVLTSCCL